MASSVELDPVPASTFTLRFACSTVSSTTRSCSWWERVADSPVVPQGTSTSVPFSICQSMSARKDASSTFPSLKGVMRATMLPEKRVDMKIPYLLITFRETFFVIFLDLIERRNHLGIFSIFSVQLPVLC